jgi:hypothetical protein
VKHDRAKHEAMLRREMMRLLLAPWPTNPYAIPEPTHAEKVEFCEAFIAMSRPPETVQAELFPPGALSPGDISRSPPGRY